MKKLNNSIKQLLKNKPQYWKYFDLTAEDFMSVEEVCKKNQKKYWDNHKF